MKRAVIFVFSLLLGSGLALASDDSDDAALLVIGEGVEGAADEQSLEAQFRGRPPSDMTVRGSTEKWNTTGYMVGSIQDMNWEKGFWWSSGELEFWAGGGLSVDDQAYPVLKYNLSVLGEDNYLWKNLDPSNNSKTVVIQYHNNYGSPFFSTFDPAVYHATKSNLILTRTKKPYSSFSQTRAHMRFPNGIATVASQQPAQHNQKKVSGKIIHVARTVGWISNVCSVYLHRGGSKSIDAEESFTQPVWSNETETFVNRTGTRMGKKKIPNVILLDTAYEDICEYAEYAAQSLADVSVEFVGRIPEPVGAVPATSNPEIEGIKVHFRNDDD